MLSANLRFSQRFSSDGLSIEAFLEEIRKLSAHKSPRSKPCPRPQLGLALRARLRQSEGMLGVDLMHTSHHHVADCRSPALSAVRSLLELP